MQFVQTDIWINRNGSDYVIDLAKPYFFDVRTIFKYYGNTSEARNILKRIKWERNRGIRIIQSAPIEYIKFLVQNNKNRNKGITKEEVAKALDFHINRWMKNVKHHCLPMEDYICRIDYFIEHFGI